jgi:hypothetical protein
MSYASFVDLIAFKGRGGGLFVSKMQKDFLFSIDLKLYSYSKRVI